VAALGLLWASRPAPVRQAIQFTFGPPDDEQLESEHPVPSPDGSSIAFLARTTGQRRSIWIREIGTTGLRHLDDTDGVVGVPFWSPDGAWVGFVAEGKLRKVRASGGPAVTICASPSNLGATWNRDNLIVLAPTNRTTLFSVPAGGGALTPITTLNAERNENSHRWPQFLPDGRHFLFTARSDVIEHTVVYVGSLDSRTITPLFPAQSNVSFASGYLLFARDGTLMARRFDAGTLTPSGEAFAVGPRVGHTTPSASAHFGTSLDGRVLAYQGGVRPLSSLTWFDRAGTSLGTVGKEDDFTELRLSPDAKLAAVVIPDRDSGNRDIWLSDLRSGTLTRLTSNPANDWQPTWSPDGRRIAFASDRNGQSSVYVKTLDGGDEERLLQVPNHGVFPLDWSKDGSVMTLNIDNLAGFPTMAAMRLAGDRTPFPAGPAPETSEEAMLSRDARWVSFYMVQAGVRDIYVAPFPRGARRRISVGGGSLAQWKADDSELYFAALDGSIMAAPVHGGSALEVGTPARLFRPCGGLPIAPTPLYLYDVTADGSRFLTICRSPASTPSAITVSVDWTAALK
jgi:eukaryotic-like serine/threonine-protein kinase